MPAEEARTLVAQMNVGYLATVGEDGAPWCSLVVYGPTADGDPVLLVSSMAEHGRNLLHDPRASLAINDPSLPGDPLDRPRITLAGRAACSPRAIVPRRRSTRTPPRVPGAMLYAGWDDFTLWVLEVDRIRWVGGFASMATVSHDEYRGAEPDPTAPIAAKSVAHLNKDHTDGLLLIAREIAGARGAVSAVLHGHRPLRHRPQLHRCRPVRRCPRAVRRAAADGEGRAPGDRRARAARARVGRRRATDCKNPVTPSARVAITQVMATKRSRRKRRHQPSRGGRALTGHARVYVPIIHGVGVTDEEDWASRSVEPLARWWEDSRGARRLACQGGCHDRSTGHVHLEIVGTGGPVRVDLDPVHWSVPALGRWSAASSILKAGLLIGLLDVIAFFPRVVGPLTQSRAADPFTLRPERRAIRAFLSFVLRGLSLPLLALLAAFLSLWSDRLRAILVDAVVWVTDDGERSKLVHDLRRRIERRNERSTVLLGHSQGGAIAAEVERELRGRREVSLVTLGTGHALLKMLHVVLPGWSLRRSFAIWALVYSWLLGVALMLAFLAVQVAGAVATWVAGSARWGGATWLWDVDPRASAALARESAIRLTSFSPLVIQGVPWQVLALVAVSGAVAGLVIRDVVEGYADQLIRELRNGAQGVDIVATHDPVSLSMLTLGDPRRVHAVSQTASTTLDHVTYFENAPLVLSAIVSQIESAAGIRSGDTARDGAGSDAGGRLLRCGLVSRIALRPLVVPVAWVVCSPLQTALPAGLGLVAFAALAAAGSLAVSLCCRRWLRRVASACRTAPQDVGSAAGYRERSRSRGWGLVQGVLAIPLIGGGALALTLAERPGSSRALVAIGQLSGVAFLCGLVLALAAWTAASGSRRSDIAAGFALLIAALMWAAHHTTFGGIVAAIYLAAATWAAARLRRFPDPLRGLTAS